MKVLIAADHGGYELKEALEDYLENKGIEVEDIGNHELDPDDDYPDFVFPLAQRISEKGGIGIVIGRSGNGEVIAANKVRGVKAALCTNVKHAKKAREDNHANVLSLGADFVDNDTAKEIADVFINTEFSKEDRHVRRVAKITSYESSDS